MANATLMKSIFIETTNEPGIASQLTSLIAEQANANILSLWGGVVNGKGNFFIFTDNNSGVLNALKDANLGHATEKELVLLKVPDQKGACYQVTDKIGNAGINIDMLYTTIFNKETALVLLTEDNQKTLKLFQ